MCDRLNIMIFDQHTNILIELQAQIRCLSIIWSTPMSWWWPAKRHIPTMVGLCSLNIKVINNPTNHDYDPTNIPIELYAHVRARANARPAPHHRWSGDSAPSHWDALNKNLIKLISVSRNVPWYISDIQFNGHVIWQIYISWHAWHEWDQIYAVRYTSLA